MEDSAGGGGALVEEGEDEDEDEGDGLCECRRSTRYMRLPNGVTVQVHVCSLIARQVGYLITALFAEGMGYTLPARQPTHPPAPSFPSLRFCSKGEIAWS